MLRAIAIAILAPALMDAGFVPYRLVRRPLRGDTLLKVIGKAVKNSGIDESLFSEKLELLARIETRPNSRGSLDRLHRSSTPPSPLDLLINDDFTHAFFVAGYGAMRRTETGDFSPSSQRKMRGSRYQRVASLFEDHIALQPMESWLRELPEKRMAEAIELINASTPPEIQFDGKFSNDEDQFMFDFEGQSTPFSSLSDGYKAFIAFISDLLFNLNEVVPKKMSMTDIPGIVLVDEVDLHLHPLWQQRVIEDLSRTFPNLQFVFSSHSPLIVNSLDHLNVLVTEDAEDGSTTVKKLDEFVYGRTVDQLLLSSYFGLETTRPLASQRETDIVLEKAMEGDEDAAIDFLGMIAKRSNPNQT